MYSNIQKKNIQVDQKVKTQIANTFKIVVKTTKN